MWRSWVRRIWPGAARECGKRPRSPLPRLLVRYAIEAVEQRLLLAGANNQVDGGVVVDIGSATVTEGQSAAVLVAITLSQPAAVPVSVVYVTADGSAKLGDDYYVRTGIIEFAPGEITQTLDIQPWIADDNTYEQPESFSINLSLPTSAVIGINQGTVTILDNDAMPSVSIEDASVVEGKSGIANAVFTVSLSTVSGADTTIQYATADGSARAGGDYTAAAGMVTIVAGQVSSTITVPVIGNTVVEPDKTFFVNLADAANAGIDRAQAMGTIINDDLPTLSIGEVTAAEGGTAAADVTVRLSEPFYHPVTVAYATADGAAIAGSDYTAASGVITFEPGQTSATIDVQPWIIDDLIRENAQTFSISLSSPSNATIDHGQGTVTILDNDPDPSVSINDVSVIEGDSGFTDANFTVALSNLSDFPVTVRYATANDTAVGGIGFRYATGTLTFAPGQTSQNIAVPVVGDTRVEPDQTFLVNLYDATGGTVGRGQGIGTIVNDDIMPAFSIGDVSVVEGDSGTKNMEFVITLWPPATNLVTVRYATVDGTAKAGSDYTATHSALMYQPGQTSRTILVPIFGDTLVESDEVFTVELTLPLNAILGRGQATGTIINDDLPSVSISDVSIREGSALPATATATVTLSAAVDRAVTVAYASADGSARAGDDYIAGGGTITFDPGQTSKTIDIQPWIIDDTIYETTKSFSIQLTSPPNATINRGQSTVTIMDDDLPALSINDVSRREGLSGITAMDFTVSLSGVSTLTTTVWYATADGTALAGRDYLARSGTVTFAPGETARVVRIVIPGDNILEPARTLTVNLSDSANATIARAQGTGTVINEPVVMPVKVSLVSPATVITDKQTARINIGTVRKGATGPVKVFKVTNTGKTSLTLSSLKLPAGYQLVNGLVPRLAAGASDTFTIRLLTTKVGTFAGSVSFVCGTTSFRFPITASVTAEKK